MIHRFEIVSSTSARPDADQIIFCDGTGGRLFRAETDLELSHWRPNRTPAEFRAGTSTEICFRFLDNPRPGAWMVAVNNHVDVDGILSVYALVHSSHALGHRRTIIDAAEMGDFWGWDAEQVCLVSVERKTGWLHELWFPGHLWADTEGKWLVPGLTYHDGMGSYQLDNPRLIAAFGENIFERFRAFDIAGRAR